MKRRGVLAALAAALGLSAQMRLKPKPNQCPVCYAAAEPYNRPTEAEAYGPGICLVGPPGVAQNSVCRQPSDAELAGPMERITRCRACNCAFYQDAVK